MKVKGFTLVEFVIVIALIGILSAIALPRIVDMGTRSRETAVKAIASTISQASRIGLASCEANLKKLDVSGACTETAGYIFMEGQRIAIVNKWPSATATTDGAGVATAANIQTSGTMTVTESVGRLSVTMNGAKTPIACGVSYENAVPGVSPIITVTISGC